MRPERIIHPRRIDHLYVACGHRLTPRSATTTLRLYRLLTLAAVQRERELPTRIMQRFQALAQERVGEAMAQGRARALRRPLLRPAPPAAALAAGPPGPFHRQRPEPRFALADIGDLLAARDAGGAASP